MRATKVLVFAAIAASGFAATIPKAQAGINIDIGLAPACPYGYYDSVPYGCAPYGYYGPEWFRGRVFIGAGPWFHGPRNFRGHVNTAFHPDHGYHGAMPNRGDRPEAGRRFDRGHFSGNEMRDGRGHAIEGRH